MPAVTVKSSGLYGLVLAGGKSRRMGAPKAFFSYHRVAESKRMYQLLEELVQDAYYSLRSDQALLPIYHDARQIIDSHDGWGPLASLVDAFNHVEKSSWLVVAVDMPFLVKGDLRRLLDARTEDRGITAFADEAGGVIPMPAIYEHSTARMARELIARGRRAIKALGDAMEPLTLKPDDIEHLKNINTPEESELAMEASHRDGGTETIHAGSGGRRAAIQGIRPPFPP